MGVRTTAKKVGEVLGADWDGRRSLEFAIEAASAVVDDVIAGSEVAVSAARAELVERWLAAHMYVQSDRIYTSKSTGGASGSFVVGKNQTPYLDQATALDPTGDLASAFAENASAAWLGKTDPQKLTYQDRN